MKADKQTKALPVNLLLEGRLCLVVGGGKVALRKCGSLLAAGAQVRVVSPAVGLELEKLAAERKLELVARPFKPADIKNAALVFACTDKRTVNRRILDACRKARVLCSCVDGNWSQSDFTSPAVTSHAGLTLAVSTGGQSCRRAKLVKESLARHIESMETADLVVAGTDHRFLGLQEREPFHLAGARLERVGTMLMQLWGVHEFVLLNTCNRIEILAVASRPVIKAGILCHALGFDRLHKDKYYQLEGPAAWEHSALVCAGMFSQTPGENHIAAQMKEALSFSVAQGWAGGMLQEWLASALHMSKHIKNDVVPEIPVCEIEDLALLALKEQYRGLQNKTIMLIGSGMVGRGLAAGALRSGAKVLWCYHRNKPELPPEWSGHVKLCTFSAIKSRLKTADAVVCAVEAAGFVLHGGHAPCFNSEKQVTLIDLGVPRNIDPALAQTAGSLKIIDIEKLKHTYGGKQADIKKYTARCRKIVHAHREHYDRLMESFQGGNA